PGSSVARNPPHPLPIDSRYASLPAHKARKLDSRPWKKRFYRRINPSHVFPDQQASYNHEQRLLSNECRRVDRSGIAVKVQSELHAFFSAAHDKKKREMEKELSKEAKEVLERHVKENLNALEQQRRRRVGGFLVQKWWEEVQGSGRKERRNIMKEQGLLGVRDGEGQGQGEDKEEGGGVGLGLGGDEKNNVDKDEYEWDTESDSDDDDDLVPVERGERFEYQREM
ncbi:MAG: hypothetical protein Q9184_008045, partial [Pyrenodesmia sp. 2 TL-2023]